MFTNYTTQYTNISLCFTEFSTAYYIVIQPHFDGNLSLQNNSVLLNLNTTTAPPPLDINVYIYIHKSSL